MLNIMNKSIVLPGRTGPCGSCTSGHDLTAACDFSQCSNITKFYVAAVFTSTSSQGKVLQLHVLHWNCNSNVDLVLNGTSTEYPSVYEFMPELPIDTTNFTLILSLTHGTNQNVQFLASQDGHPLITIVAKGKK